MEDEQIPGQMTIDECIELLRLGTEEIAAELIADLRNIQGTDEAA